MEWDDWGLKTGDDVLDVMLRTNTTAHQMHKVLAKTDGVRLAGLLADALDLALARAEKAEAERDAALGAAGQAVAMLKESHLSELARIIEERCFAARSTKKEG